MKEIAITQLKEDRLHGELNFPLEVYYTILGKIDKELFLHWHKEIELIYIKSGEGVFNINLESISVTKGDILIIPPIALHSGKANGFCECSTIVLNLNLLKSDILDKVFIKYLRPINMAKN